MKTQLRLFITFIALACVSFQANAFSYYITFTGSGASTTVDSVVVQNLYKGTQVKVPAGIQLRLYDVETSLNKLNTITDFACVYPNPTTNNAIFSFLAKNKGNTQIAVYGIDGKKVTGLDLDLLQGKNSFQLSLPKGVYVIQVKGNGFSYSIKTISLRIADCQPMITLVGNSPDSKLQKASNPAVPEVKLQYNAGDQILYKGYSGNFCTILTDKPTETKTTDFKFVNCTDADGNHYTVIHIGTQTWMGENLKTTKYRNGDVIPKVIDNAEWGALNTGAWCDYDNNAANGTKNGHLYNWYAATDSRIIAPQGWHVPSDTEWADLLNYMIANGFNHDGTITGNKIAKSLAATTDWKTYYTAGTIGNDLSKNNSSGFTAFPGGYRYDGGPFNSIGSSEHWWSTTPFDSEQALRRSLNYDYGYLDRSSRYKKAGISVRCVWDEIENAHIPSGTFLMGSPTTEVNRNTNETQHTVTLSAFRMSKYEITNAQYAIFLNSKGIGSNGLYAAGAYPSQTLIYASSGSYDFGLHYSGSQWVPVAGYENNPIINVTWYGAAEYATYAGGTLPTEAQWEYACRAVTTTPFNTGSCLTNLHANYYWAAPYSTCTNTVTSYPGKTKAVGTYASNGFGLYDMHGNMWEWCADWFGTYPSSPQTNPTGAETGSSRVVRSGNFDSDARYCRSAYRFANSPDSYYLVGFRVVFVP